MTTIEPEASVPAADHAPVRQQGPARTSIGIGLSLLAGVMLNLAQPAVSGMWFLAPFATVPMLVAAYRFLPRRLTGLAMGLTWWVMWAGWFYYAGRQVMPAWIAASFSLLPLISGTVLGSFDRIFNERTSYRFFLLSMPAVWTGWDFLLSQNLLTTTEGSLAYTMAPAPILIQPISLLGSPALSFMVLMFGATLGLAVLRWMDARSAPIDSVPVAADVARKVATWGLALTLLWVVVSVGLFFNTRAAFGPTARIATLQMGADSDFGPNAKGRFGAASKAVVERETRASAAEGAQMVVMPEFLLDFDPRVTDAQWIPGLARETGAYLQVGWLTLNDDDTQNNTVGLWAPDGRLVGIYNKIHPVVAVGERFKAPVRYPVFETALGPIGMIICFDMGFYDTTRNLVTNGAKIITASAGDWSDVADARVATARLRAIENAVGYVKDDKMGGNALINPDGTIVAQGVPGGDGVPSGHTVGDVAQGPGDTLYTSIGDFFGILTVLGLAVRIYFQLRVRSHARRGNAHTGLT